MKKDEDPDWERRIAPTVDVPLDAPDDWPSAIVRFLFCSYFGTYVYWKDLRKIELLFGHPFYYPTAPPEKEGGFMSIANQPRNLPSLPARRS